ncbi:MAG TPA: TIGR03435 family protein [Bryobacteraceae bacterium]
MKRPLAALLLLSAAAIAQAPAFEVASIRPAGDSPRPLGEALFCPFVCVNVGLLKIAGTRVDITWMALDELLTKAYRIRPDQLSGPDWTRNQRFEILATIPEGVSSSQVPEMLQALLVERFHLTAHRETRDQPVYALIVDKNGPILKESTEAAATPDVPGDRTLYSPQGPVETRQTENGTMITRGPWGPMRMYLTRSDENRPEFELLQVTMPLLADALTQFMDRPVIDRTNLKGAYRVAIWSRDMHAFAVAKRAALGPPRPAPTPDSPNGTGSLASDPSGNSTIFKTMEKLGLKLERTKAPVEILVVDHLERSPTEN